MPMWLVILIVAAVAVVLVVAVWRSSGRAPVREHRPPDAAEAERTRKAGMIETDDFPSRSGFFH